MRLVTFTDGLTSSSAPTTSADSYQSPTNWPTIRPSLILDFANSRSLDPRVTFTRASTATRVNDRGFLETVSTNVPRFDHDPVTLASKGLLIEEARTNLLTYSQTFNNVAWTRSNLTATAAAVTGPDGTLSGWSLTDTVDGGAVTHQISQVYTKAASAVTYTTYYVVKKGDRTWWRVTLDDGSSVNQSFASFNLDTLAAPTVGTAAGTFVNGTGGWIALSNGFYVMWYSATTGTETTVRTRLIPSTSAGSASYTGTGTIPGYLYHSQLEVGAFPTSIIPTTSAAVTRSADIATMTGANFSSWYREDEGTIFVTTDLTSKGSDQTVLAINNATQNEQIDVRLTSVVTSRMRDGGVDQATLTYSLTPAVGTTYRIARSWKVNDFSLAVNGLAGTTDASGTIGTPTQMEIGARTTANHLAGRISKIVFYPKRITDAEMLAITA